MTDTQQKFLDFFIKQKPEKIIAAIEIINTLQNKSIEELQTAIKLSPNENIKKIIKDILKLKIDKL